MAASDLALWELEGRDGQRYSQFSWRSRLALRHKGLEAELRPVRISDKAAIAFSGQGHVPILVDGETVVADSWKIAEHLEQAYPDRPSLFGGPAGKGFARFVNAWVDRTLIPRLVPLIMIDVVARLDDGDAAHLRGGIEAVFKAPLETLAADRDSRIKDFRKLLDPARATLKAQPFLAGEAPAYPDHILFSLFQWARIVTAFPVLEPGDAVGAWFERMLDAYDGHGRAEPGLGSGSGSGSGSGR